MPRLEPIVASGRLILSDPEPPTLDPYRGYGAWVDVFDYDPAYATNPTIDTTDVLDMAADGGWRRSTSKPPDSTTVPPAGSSTPGC